MKITQRILFIILAVFLMSPAMAQDNRTLETKVADILAQFPAQSFDHTNKLMVQILETGAPGIAKFCDLLVLRGTGNDVQARYALESLARYAGAPEHEKDRKLVESSLLTALDKASDKEVKAFLIRRLQYCGGAESVSAMEKYLNSSDLYAPALAVLTDAGSPEAGAVILKNLSDKSGLQQQAMVKTLGELKYKPAEQTLIGLSKSDDKALLLQVYAALAKIGGEDSYDVFKDAAKTNKSQSDQTALMTSYLEYAKRMYEEGAEKIGNFLCLAVMKNCAQDNQLIYRSGALAIQTFGSNAWFLKENENNHNAYRTAVLKYSSAQLNSENVTLWINALKKAPAETQAEIIHFLAKRTEPDVLQNAILPNLNSGDEVVRTEAIRSLALNQGSKAVPVLLEQLQKTQNSVDRAEIEKALLITCSGKECDLLAAKLDEIERYRKSCPDSRSGSPRATQTFDEMMKLCKSARTTSHCSFCLFSQCCTTGKCTGTDRLAQTNFGCEVARKYSAGAHRLYSGAKKPDPALVLTEIQKQQPNRKMIRSFVVERPKALKTVVGLLE